MAAALRGSTYSPPIVAAAAWALPGLGYFLIGQRTRGLTIGITVITLFILGLLIGGIRVLEVPTWDDRGMSSDTTLMREIRAKPWSIPQFLAGPIAIVGGAWSVSAATVDKAAGREQPAGARSHSRINEIAVLYTAVAGMLNLLAIIDSSYRAA